jgi:hypothetical protein
MYLHEMQKIENSNLSTPANDIIQHKLGGKFRVLFLIIRRMIQNEHNHS